MKDIILDFHDNLECRIGMESFVDFLAIFDEFNKWICSMIRIIFLRPDNITRSFYETLLALGPN